MSAAALSALQFGEREGGADREGRARVGAGTAQNGGFRLRGGPPPRGAQPQGRDLARPCGEHLRGGRLLWGCWGLALGAPRPEAVKVGGPCRV